VNYLLTGVAGFIGAVTARQLLEQGHRVIGLDNLNDYYDVALKRHRLERLQCDPKFSFHQVDIEDLNGLHGLFKSEKIDAVINLAARAGVRYSMENPEVYMRTNLIGTMHLLNLMRDFGVKKMVLASTSSLYAGQKMPYTEELAVNTPISPYAASKKAAEMLAYSYHHLYQLDISVVRYFTVYGPASRPDMAIFRFIHWIKHNQPIEILGDGLQARDFTFVEDIARGTIQALKPLGYEVINLGGGNNPIDLFQVIAILEKLIGKKALVHTSEGHAADMKETWADISKAKRLLGWTPLTELAEGLRQSVEWHNQTESKGFKLTP
jgi:UDP-glucuronate 4-epimerase